MKHFPTGTFVILGASSAIARAVAEEIAARGNSLVLAGRDTDDIERLAADLRIRHGVRAETVFFDALRTDTHETLAASVAQQFPDLAGVVLVFGTMTDQSQAERDFTKAEAMIASNFTGAASILSRFANIFEDKKAGVIVGVSSVAGDRGRMSNYVYGSAKGAFSLFVQGLRNRMFHVGVRVITVKPGFVDTALTHGLKLPPIVAPPQAVAKDICKAIAGNADVIYTPFFWRYIMLIIKHLPEFVFKRLKM